MPIVAMGTTLKKGETAIANLTSIDGISVSSDTIDTTNLSTAGGYKTFVTSLKRCRRSFNFRPFRLCFSRNLIN